MALHLIFDLDGTIFDSAPDFHSSLSQLFIKYNIEPIPLEEARSYIGNGFRGFVERFSPNPDTQTVKQIYNEFLDIYENNFLKQTKPYDGALDFIKDTPYEISLCTNKPKKFAVSTLEHYKIFDNKWRGLVYGDTFVTPKPHPQGIEHLISLSNIQKDKTIFIGDGLPDILAAQNAGIPFIGVGFGYYPHLDLKKQGADYIIHSYKELPHILNALIKN